MSKFFELKNVIKVIITPLESKWNNPFFWNQNKNYGIMKKMSPDLVTHTQTCNVSGSSGKKRMPCPCTPKFKIRKFKKKHLEKCEKQINCPTIKHKCTKEQCNVTSVENSNNNNENQ